MRLRVDRWWPGCLLIALAMLLYTAHAVALPHHDSGAPHVHVASATVTSPELICADRGRPVAEHACRADAGDHQMARQTSPQTTVAEPHAPVAQLPVAASEDREPPRAVVPDLDRALLQVWRH